MTKNSVKGISWIELLVVVLIVAIIAAWAVPHVRSWLTNMESYKVASTIKTLLNHSKYEAYTHKERIALCGSTDQISCDESGWGKNILIFNDIHGTTASDSPDRIRQPDEKILQVHPINIKNGTLVWKGAGSKNVIFQADTGLPRGSNGSFYYCTPDGKYSTRIVLSYMGHTRIEALKECKDLQP